MIKTFENKVNTDYENGIIFLLHSRYNSVHMAHPYKGSISKLTIFGI